MIARKMAWIVATTGIATAMLAWACDSADVPHDNPAQLDAQANADTSTAQDSGVTDLPDGAPPNGDCFTNPKTHFEIINACTDAQKIDKHPNLPLLLPDGGRPPPP